MPAFQVSFRQKVLEVATIFQRVKKVLPSLATDTIARITLYFAADLRRGFVRFASLLETPPIRLCFTAFDAF